MSVPLSFLLMWSTSFFLPMSSLIIFFVLMVFGEEFSFSWSVVVMEMSMDSFFMLDFLSIFFVVVVSVVSLSVLIYSELYMFSSLMKKKFIMSLSLFIISMFVLSISSDLFWVMVGWDGLGLTSLYLIMFFQNWKSFNSSMTTFILNRLGDSLIIISLVWCLSVGSKSLYSHNSLFMVFLTIGALSKSAQIPFSSWLPLAMAAPTPVSALVHSSTLVTAGVFLLIRFKSFFSDLEMSIVFFLSSMTIVLAGVSSMGEYDLKKIIALSTLSHIAMMMMFLSCNAILAALVHLHTHAMFKSLLFMISGVIIHDNKGNQDVRLISVNSIDTPMGVSMVVSLMSMLGIPFFAGFFSKELFLLYSVESNSFHLGVLFIFGAAITSSYSFRIIFFIFCCKNPILLEKKSSLNWVIFFMMGLMASVSAAGALRFLEESELFVSPSSYFFVLNKSIFLYIFLGVIFGIFLSLIQGIQPVWTIKWAYTMWFINSFAFFSQKYLMDSSFFFLKKFDIKGMVDHIFFFKGSLLKDFSDKLSLTFLPYPPFFICIVCMFTIPLILWW